MIEPDFDETLADGERDESLRRLTRDAELARDFVLRVAGDVVEPACARGFVKSQSVLIGPVEARNKTNDLVTFVRPSCPLC
jgi:hypothetical protein